jgi:hypothetical protein
MDMCQPGFSDFESATRKEPLCSARAWTVDVFYDQRKVDSTMNLSRIKLVAALAGSALACGSVLVGVAGVSPALADTCTPTVSGNPGIDSFTLHINTNPCGEQVRARAECVEDLPGADPLVGWVYGPIRTGTGTSEANCGAFNLYFLSYGWQNYYTSAWHYHQLGT